ncbi:MAG: flagellar biosynthetic protein FliO [Bdellovibrionaceae bacterium]|nr:flagellar biosynthetic protein FliO [Pseudobdellovibrionaceae bacterium]
MRFFVALLILFFSYGAFANAEATSEASFSAGPEEVAIETAPTKKESEIPLNLETTKKSSDSGHPAFKFLLAISILGVVGVGAYVFIRKYSKTNFAINKHNQIRILTQHHLGPKKSLAIIRVAGESILIGVTDQNINMIKSLSLLDDEVPDVTNSDFEKLVDRPKASIEESKMTTDIDSEDEEFSIRGIKDVVSKRLKGMRSLQ